MGRAASVPVKPEESNYRIRRGTSGCVQEHIESHFSFKRPDHAILADLGAIAVPIATNIAV